MFMVIVAVCQRAPSEPCCLISMVQRYGYAIGDKKIRLSVFYKLSIIILLADNQKNKRR